jgi:hypothetical protein
VIPTHTLLFRARKQLREANEERAEALAKQAQAEDAQHVAEEQARRAEERATLADEQADSWRMFAVALTGEYIVDTRITGASTNLVEGITDSLYQEWSVGRPAIDELSINAIVFDAGEERS